MGRERSRSIAQDLSARLALAVALVVALSGAGLVVGSRYSAESQLRRQSRRWTEQLAEVSRLHLWNVDRAGLENACQAAMQPPEVIGARVLDAEGRVLAEDQRRRGCQPFLRDAEPVLYADARSGRTHRLGSVELWVSEAELTAATRQQLLVFGLLGLAVVGTTVLVCRYLVRRILGEPLAQLEAGIAGIAAGDYASQLPPARQADVQAIVEGVNAMAAAIESREDALRRSEEQLGFALAAARSGVWDWNVASGETYFSDRYSTMLGYEPGELVPGYETWRELTHPEDREVARGAVEAHLRGETELYAVEHRLRCKDGSYRWTAAQGCLISWTETGEPQRFVGVHIDIHDRIAAAETLRRAKEAAEQATRARDEFLANMSHEIRTPLNGVIGMTSALLHSELGPEQREFVETIQSSGRGLLSIVNDVLDLSRLEAGALQIASEPFAPDRLCREVEELMAHSASERGLGLRLELPAEVPALEGDPGRIRQVLFNLVSNAIKFTDEGGVRLVLGVESGAEGEVELRYSVYDTGVGIEPSQRARLFRRFSQLDSSSTRTRGGAGLGLAISQRLCELMGGELGVESQPGQGSCFSLALRLPRAGAIASEPAGPALPEGLERRVLLAEDNRVNARVAQALLGRLGLRVETVRTGREALAALRERRYDLVLMDVQMPELDGLAAAAEIRARERAAGTGERVPILALTASALPEDQRACLAAGMDDYLAKPIELEALEQKLATLLAGCPR